MKRKAMPEVKEANVNVTPLIDIVMCLIIFFMLVTKIGVTTGAIPMPNLVQSVFLGTTIDDMGNTLTVNVVKSSNNVDAEVSALVHGESKVLDHQTLVGVFKELKASNANFQIIIRAEADVPYSMIVPVLLASSEAGIMNIDFNTKKPQ